MREWIDYKQWASDGGDRSPLTATAFGTKLTDRGFAKHHSDAEVKAIVTQAMADSGATPAAVYAFHKTGVYVTSDNESRWSPEQLRAWKYAIEEYDSLANCPNILV